MARPAEPSFEPIDTYEDHRMALAFAPLAFKFPPQIQKSKTILRSPPPPPEQSPEGAE